MSVLIIAMKKTEIQLIVLNLTLVFQLTPMMASNILYNEKQY